MQLRLLDCTLEFNVSTALLKAIIAIGMCLLILQPETIFASSLACESVFSSPEESTEVLGQLLKFQSQHDLREDLISERLLKFENLIFDYASADEIQAYQHLATNEQARLSENQQASFRQYTSQGGAYASINDYLRDSKRARVNRKVVKPLAQNMIKGFTKLTPLPKGLLLFRGMSFKREPPTYRRGEIVHTSGFNLARPGRCAWVCKLCAS